MMAGKTNHAEVDYYAKTSHAERWIITRVCWQDTSFPGKKGHSHSVVDLLSEPTSTCYANTFQGVNA